MTLTELMYFRMGVASALATPDTSWGRAAGCLKSRSVIGDAFTSVTFPPRPEGVGENLKNTVATGKGHDERDSRDSPVPARRALGVRCGPASNDQRSVVSEDTQRHTEPEHGCVVCSLAALPDSACARSLMADGTLDRLAADIVPGPSVSFRCRGPFSRWSLS